MSQESRQPAVPVHQAWPADKFYWALLDAPGVPVKPGWLGGSSDGALRALLQEWLPTPIDRVHAVYARVDARSVLACAADAAVLAALDPQVRTLCPCSLPEPLREAAVNPACLNLLTARFEPARSRRARASRARAVLAGTVAALLLFSAGLLHRSSRLEHHARLARAQAAAVVAAAMPDGAEGDEERAIVRFRVQLDRLRSLTPDPASLNQMPDAGLELARLLEVFPRGTSARVELVSISPGSMVLTAEVGPDADAVARALTPPPGWVLSEPALEAGGDHARLRARFSRSEPSPGAGGGPP